LTISEFLLFISDRALTNPKSYLQPGQNGPYNDPETAVRNYGHWLITFSKCFELTGEQIYLKKIKELAEYLISDDARPHGFSFHHRSKEGKDRCNGLIGQAWTLEALICASSILGDTRYAELGEEVFFQHKFNAEFGLWNRLETDGGLLSIDDTFNHQLWFASCAALLNTPRGEEVRERIFRFMNCLLENLSVLDNGLIYHPIERRLNQNDSRLSIKSKLRNVVESLLPISLKRKGQSRHNNNELREKMIYKSVGYHQFNMYAFAILKETLPDHSFWLSPEFGRLVDYLLSNEFKNEVSDNIYGYPYNPPGFEVPFALSVLTSYSEDELVGISSWWVNEQLKRCYNPETKMMDRNTEDYRTHTARIYEVTRLPISILNTIKIKTQSLGDSSQVFY